MKQLDIAPIASYLLNQPVPFSSLGFMHPIFSPTNTVEQLPFMALSNLK
jgi:hypothetical protein